MRLIPHFHNRHSEQSRGCNAAAEGGEARLSIPLPNSPVTSRDVSHWPDMTGRRKLRYACASHVGYSRGDRLQFFHSLEDRIGVCQAVPCNCSNYPTRLRNLLERVRCFM